MSYNDHCNRGLKGSQTLFVMHAVLQARGQCILLLLGHLCQLKPPYVVIYLLHEAYLIRFLFCILLFRKHISHHKNH